MYCYRCGQRLAESARHCPNCGAAIFYNENGPLDGTGQADCDACADESFGSAYSTHDPYKTNTDGGSSYGAESHYTYDPQTGSYRYSGGSGSSQPGAGSGGYSYGPSGGYGQASYTPPPAPSKQDGYALAALICAIASLCCCFVPYVGLPLSIGAVVLGIMGLKSPQRKSLAIVGLVLGGVMLLLNGLILGLSVYYAAHPEWMQEWIQQMQEIIGESAEFYVK